MSSIQKVEYQTLTEAFVDKKNETTHGIGFIINRQKEVFYSYNEMYTKALHLLGYLQKTGLKKGDNLILQLQDNEEFIRTFWACILGGIVPIPITADGMDGNKQKLFKVMREVEKGWIIGETDNLSGLIDFAQMENIHSPILEKFSIKMEQALAHEEPGYIPQVHPDDIAFIQYSSGSTGSPKGVVLTHRNLIFNITDIIDRAAFESRDIMVSWMPLTHDMGLIACHLSLTVANMVHYLMKAALFVRRPNLWMEKVTEHKATVLALPNFGLQHSLNALNRGKAPSYDFSSVRLIFNGAEPISIKVCHAFLDKTGEFGMRRNVLFPSYGMAEACVGVSFPNVAEENRLNEVYIDRSDLEVGNSIKYVQKDQTNAIGLVDEGYPLNNCRIRICDFDDHELDDNTLGIIQIKGKNVTSGYHNNEKATRESFTNDDWFRTGDIGFVNQGRLVVVGRQKEMIIVNGQNYFSHDLERIAAAGIKEIDENKIAITSIRDEETELEKTLVFVVHRGKNQSFIPKMFALRKHFLKTNGISLDVIIPVPRLPKTTSGKLKRYELRDRYSNGHFQEVIEDISHLMGTDQSDNMEENNDIKKKVDRHSLLEVEQKLLSICHEVAPNLKLDVHDNFFGKGINSLVLVQIAEKTNETFQIKIKNDDFFYYTSIHQLSKYICGFENRLKPDKGYDNKKKKEIEDTDIAIVGMSTVVPGASNIYEFWSNLCGGIESVGPIPTTRKKDLEKFMSSTNRVYPDKYPVAGYLPHIDQFDYHFFKILKREAVAMSPAQRLFMQNAYSALEDAGYGGNVLKSTNTGVYVGYIADLDGYQYQELLRQSYDSNTPTGGLSANISGRFSYFMDFNGPSVNVDSACSSSMSALKLACSGIQNGDCEQAVVGGVEIKTLPMVGSEKIGIESVDGRTRPFADDSSGTGTGEGVVSVFIKPYKNAIEDKDNIYGVIRSVSTNQDGYSVGLSAPNPNAQEALIANAINEAELLPEDISYVEAHGTGTKLGDPVEFSALSNAFQQKNINEQHCAIGSVKSNIGHLYASSGLISIVKACMMLVNKKIPETINTNKLHSGIDFEQSPFYVNREYKEWETDGRLRRCGVSNFGFSGTNCHTVLEEYVEKYPRKVETKAFPIIISGQSKGELEILIKEYYNFLITCKNLPSLLDISYTLSMGRGHYSHRVALIAVDTEDLIRKLEEIEFKTNFHEGRYAGVINIVNDHLKPNSKWYDISSEKVGMLNQLTMDYIGTLNDSKEKSDRLKLISRLNQLYVRGSEPLWEDFFRNEDYRRVSLPTYVYRPTRSWPEF